jgi:hypothetical protein
MDNPSPPNPLVAYVERILAAQAYWTAQRFDSAPEPPEQPMPDHYRLKFQPGYPAYQPEVDLAEARREISEKIAEYQMEKRPNRYLLITAQPGVGKTYLAVQAVQQLAQLHVRVLYAMPTHAHFDTISDFDNFDGGYDWYHWLALSAESPETKNTMCLYANEMVVWTRKGYPAMKLCDSLCAVYKPNCEFRRQALRSERIIAGVHNHVSLGMAISDFDLAIVDELPISAFLRPRHVPADGLRLNGAGPVVDLSEKLSTICASGERTLGWPLLDQLAPLLTDVYAQFEDYASALPVTPWISRADQVGQAPYWYLPDLLELLVQEKAAYDAGAKQWLERVILTKHGLDLLQRAEPWDGLPAHVVFLDATGSAAVYKQLFRREIEVYAPNVKRAGRVYQVVKRLHGLGTFLEKVPGQIEPQNGEDDKRLRRLSKQGLDALKFCAAMIEAKGYKNPGCVTFKSAVPEFEQVFGAGRVLHFHAQRGSNDLIDADAGFVVGAPQPQDGDIMQAVKILWPRRSRPFCLVEHNGAHPARSEELRAYQYFDERGQAVRRVSGFWNDPDLNAVADVMREQELVQAIHRFRPITRDVPVYLLTSIPIEEPLDGIFEDYSEVMGIPEGIHNWQAWKRLMEWLPNVHKTGQPVSNHDIAEATGLSYDTIWRQKWLDIILKIYPDDWKIDRIVPATGGGKKSLTPINEGRNRVLL